MKIKQTFKLFLVVFSLLIINSCTENNKTISSFSLNKVDGIYKLKEKPFTGMVIDTTKSGRVLLTFNCIEGKIVGEYLTYYKENGNLKQRTTYQNGKKTGPFIKLTKDGGNVISGEYLNYKKNGVWKEFYNNGNLKSVGKYKNNLQNGEWKYYFYSGKIKAVGNYENGDKSRLGTTDIPISGRFGEWIFYSEETGKIEQKCEFENGIRSGKLIAFYPNGQIEAKGTCKNDVLDGVFEFFDESGNLQSKEIWEDGKNISKE